MSVSSVGASFGYIDPASIGAAQQAASSQADTDPTPPAVPRPTEVSPPQSPQAGSSDTPKFSVATGAALVQVQEKASAA